MEESETLYYEQSHVKVTNTRMVIGDTTYFIDSITSVRTKKTNNRKIQVVNRSQLNLSLAVLAISILLFFLAGLIMVVFESSTLSNIGGIVLLISLGLGAVGFIGGLSARHSKWLPEYHLIITSASGETDALKSASPDVIESITNAINKAKTASN